MSRWHDHLLRRVRGLLLVALMSVPIAVAGHHHPKAADGAPVSCPICVVVHHTPAVKLVVQPRIALVLCRFTRPVARLALPAEIFRPFTSGRSPPLLFTARAS